MLSQDTRVPDFADPYTYPDSTVLRNKFGIHDSAELALAESEASWVRRQLIAEGRVTGEFDFAHLRAIHRYLFQDIFDWAGEIRTVNISKGTSHFLTQPSLLVGAERRRRARQAPRVQRRQLSWPRTPASISVSANAR